MRAIVTVVGNDKVGIIASVCSTLSDQNVNVLDISQTVLSDRFTMIMLVDTTDCIVPFAELASILEESGAQQGLSIRIQRDDIFNAMHRI